MANVVNVAVRQPAGAHAEVEELVAEAEEEEEEEEGENRMSLSEQERNLALRIKDAIKDDPELDMISDFMCVQLAIVDGDSDIQGALERVRHLQYFRQEYSIQDSVNDGRQMFARFLDLFPNFHLCYADHQGTGTNQSVLVYDNCKFDGNRVKGSEEKLRIWLGGTYYTCAMLCYDFEAIRSGTTLVAECEGYNWKQDMDFKSLKRVWSEIAAVYPVLFKKVKYFNAGTTMNLVASMLKPFLPKALRYKIEFGCKFHQRLDRVYLVPSAEEANLRYLKRVESTLRTRYENEKTFRL